MNFCNVLHNFGNCFNLQGGLKLKIAALKIPKKPPSKEPEVKKLPPAASKPCNKEKEKTKCEKTQILTKGNAKTVAVNKKGDGCKKQAEVRDGGKVRGPGRPAHRDKVS